MKVVFAHTDFRIYWPARLNALKVFLKKRNIDLEIIEIAGKGSHYSFNGADKQQLSSWHCIFPDQKLEDISSAKANMTLRKTLDKISPEIVFAGAIAFPSGAAAVRWAFENKKRVIIFDDARLVDTPRSVFVNFVKRRLYSCTYAIFCPSPAWNETFSFFGFRKEQIFYGVNVVDNVFWQNSSTKKNEILPKGYFLTISRQIPKKNLKFLLQAYQNYANSVSDPIDLILVGEGPERPELENFVRENHLKRVQFMHFLSQEELKGIFEKALCYILPSLYGETWGLTVNEAMASGLPVLVSNQAGCASTLINDSKNGYTFSPDNLEELTRILLRLHNMTESDKSQMRLKSLEIINEWGIEKFCSGVYGAIQFVASQRMKKVSLLTRFILMIWKGRYNPL